MDSDLLTLASYNKTLREDAHMHEDAGCGKQPRLTHPVKLAAGSKRPACQAEKKKHSPARIRDGAHKGISCANKNIHGRERKWNW